MAKQWWLRYGLAALVIGLAVFAVGCGGDEAAVDGGAAGVDTPAGQALLEDRCTQCHTLDRVTSESKTAAEWQQIVGSMVSKGAQLSSAEVDTLVAYLAEMYGP
ncbi:MAG: hypothetical protein MUF84_02440 [Anaerolineae bacterium]|nr:hypothetical protein [Anaerolineae bacterium]